jgi:hypothetical protein
MILIYVLVVMTWVGPSAGPMVSMQEFSNGERCEEARKALNEQAAFWPLKKDTMQAFCVLKLRAAIRRLVEIGLKAKK